VKIIALNTLAFILLILYCHQLSAQRGSGIDISYNQTAEGILIRADNTEPVPYSFKFDFDLTNLKVSTEEKKNFLVPARSEKFKITLLKRIDSTKGYNFKYEFEAQIGKTIWTKPDLDFIYELPYAPGGKFKVGQGYNGVFSHQGESALDFDMRIGTQVYAARGGIVAEVIEENRRHCPRPHCADFNNRIIIYHEDGTMAFYSHLKFGGAEVEKGDEVKQGDFIGYSGETGFCRGPHLHFEVRIPQWDKLNPIKLETLFNVVGSKKPVLLEEGKVYNKPETSM
jgi:murein DD-endopeptidase MepM/ murein hydrolase activator NlpD